MTTKKTPQFGLSLPMLTCPKCSGNCYPIKIVSHCEKCNSEFYPDVTVFEGKLRLNRYKSEEIDRYMTYLASQPMGGTLSPDKEDEDSVLTIKYKGKILEVLKQLKDEYKFPTLTLVVKYITDGFFYVLTQMRRLPGEKIYLCDDLGNKSEELKKTFLKNAYESFNQEKDEESVRNFLYSMGIHLAIREIQDTCTVDKPEKESLEDNGEGRPSNPTDQNL